MRKKQGGMGTRAVWAGEGTPAWEGAAGIPIVRQVAFAYEGVDDWRRVVLGKAKGHIYSRNTNPTVCAFEEKCRQLEGADAAVSFSTGMAAISNVFWALLSPGDRIVSVRDTYGGTSRLFLEFLPRWGVQVALCDTENHEEIEAEIAAGCKMLFLETPTNPTLKVLDINRLARAARRRGAVVAVDNSLATPVNQQPISLGADLAVHSATKCLGGHADALGGVVCGRKDLVERIFRFREIHGAALDPTAAYLLLRGMKTLHLRVAQQNESAMRIARYLSRHPAVEQVFYPGLPSHRGHEIACRQMSGFGCMLSFSLRGGLPAVKELLKRLRTCWRAANFGGVETLVGIPATTSHVECTAEEMKKLGIPEGLVRYSVGVEDCDDLLADLAQALGGRRRR